MSWQYGGGGGGGGFGGGDGAVPPYGFCTFIYFYIFIVLFEFSLILFLSPYTHNLFSLVPFSSVYRACCIRSSDLDNCCFFLSNSRIHKFISFCWIVILILIPPAHTYASIQMKYINAHITTWRKQNTRTHTQSIQFNSFIRTSGSQTVSMTLAA